MKNEEKIWKALRQCLKVYTLRDQKLKQNNTDRMKSNKLVLDFFTKTET